MMVTLIESMLVALGMAVAIIAVQVIQQEGFSLPRAAVFVVGVALACVPLL